MTNYGGHKTDVPKRSQEFEYYFDGKKTVNKAGLLLEGFSNIVIEIFSIVVLILILIRLD